jgi:hypothetical protein
MSTPLLVVSYLVVLVIANLLVTQGGQAVLLVTAVLLIPFDFAVRIRLQERWTGLHLWSRMAALIVVGGILTILTVPGSRTIASASVAAFVASSVVGAVVYAYTRARMWSVGAMAAIDSILFPLLAFTSVSVTLMVVQCALKWSASLVMLTLPLFAQEAPYATKNETSRHHPDLRQRHSGEL